MTNDHASGQQERRDFFISYTHTDQQWAEWIAMQLETAGYTLFIQAWDFRPGSNFIAEMDRAAQTTERTILVLSPSYVQSEYTFAEWAARFRRDPKGTHCLLLPIRIQPCNVEVYWVPLCTSIWWDVISRLPTSDCWRVSLVGVSSRHASRFQSASRQALKALRFLHLFLASRPFPIRATPCLRVA